MVCVGSIRDRVEPAASRSMVRYDERHRVITTSSAPRVTTAAGQRTDDGHASVERVTVTTTGQQAAHPRTDNHANNLTQKARILLAEDARLAFCTDRDALFNQASRPLTWAV